jgi:hypothetical protein
VEPKPHISNPTIATARSKESTRSVESFVEGLAGTEQENKVQAPAIPDLTLPKIAHSDMKDGVVGASVVVGASGAEEKRRAESANEEFSRERIRELGWIHRLFGGTREVERVKGQRRSEEQTVTKRRWVRGITVFGIVIGIAALAGIIWKELIAKGHDERPSGAQPKEKNSGTWPPNGQRDNPKNIPPLKDRKIDPLKMQLESAIPTSIGAAEFTVNRAGGPDNGGLNYGYSLTRRPLIVSTEDDSLKVTAQFTYWIHARLRAGTDEPWFGLKDKPRQGNLTYMASLKKSETPEDTTVNFLGGVDMQGNFPLRIRGGQDIDPAQEIAEEFAGRFDSVLREAITNYLLGK